MTDAPLCRCGCGEPALYAERHVQRSWLRRLTEKNYRIEDRGHATPCWIWAGRLEKSGYARVRIRGRRLLAHRAMYEQEIGPVPAGLQLDHLCRVPACVNPAHLEPVTAAENTRRAERAKLTEGDIREIRSSELSAAALAARFGVGEANIWAVRRGDTWKDVAPELIPRTRRGRGRSRTITDEQAAAILASMEPASVLAKQFGVSRPTITRIRAGKQWVE